MRWIVTDNIHAETWRHLLEFADIELTFDLLVKLHGEPTTSSQTINYKKQAIQARVCVLQAKEYFDAAHNSSAFTSANHCYYGAISLASLFMLIRGDGTKSLDFLRGDPRNCHHGLNFSTGCNFKSASSGINLLEQSRVEILDHGQFKNWYSILPNRGNVIALIKRIHSEATRTGWEEHGGFDNPSFSKIKGIKRELISLLKYLPDLSDDMGRYGIKVPHSRGDLQVTHDFNHKFSEYRWRLHGCATEEDRDALLEHFKVESRFASNIDAIGVTGTTAGVITFKIPHNTSARYSWPNSRDTMSHNSIYYSELEDGFEIVDLYLVAYQLSMLSRYYPDIWISCLESRCRSAKLIEKSVELIIKKFPILILSILHGTEVIISTHQIKFEL